MSPPTGRPFYPVSVSDYAPKKVRERAASEGEPAASGAADRSSETPKTPRQHPTEAHPADDPEDQHEAPLAPTGPHERPVNEPDDPNPPLPFRPRGARDDAARPDSADDQYDRDLDRLEANLQQIRRQGVDDFWLAACTPQICLARIHPLGSVVYFSILWPLPCAKLNRPIR